MNAATPSIAFPKRAPTTVARSACLSESPKYAAETSTSSEMPRFVQRRNESTAPSTRSLSGTGSMPHDGVSSTSLPSPVLTGSGSTGVISAARAAPRCAEASIGRVGRADYDGLADDYAVFLDEQSPYYEVAADALRRLLGPGDGRCLDLGCGGGHFTALATGLGWKVTGAELSADQLRRADAHLDCVELVQADATALPFPAAAFDAAFSTF